MNKKRRIDNLLKLYFKFLYKQTLQFSNKAYIVSWYNETVEFRRNLSLRSLAHKKVTRLHRNSF